MQIVNTGSLGNIGKPLTQELVQKGHSVTVISSKTFKGADIVYLMEAWEGIGSIFEKDVESGSLYEDFHLNKPVLGKVKLEKSAKELAVVYHNSTK